jgi:hypothetical protein
MKKPNPYPRVSARSVLDAVEQWAEGFVMLRETGSLLGGLDRVDAILIPVSYDTMLWRALKYDQGPVGVEVKVSRSDFLNGLHSGQFDRYADYLSGLYIATTKDCCRTQEVPRCFGHLVCTRRHGRSRVKSGDNDILACVCRRHPTFEPMVWDQKKLFKLFHRFMQWFVEKQKAEKRRCVRTTKEVQRRFGQILAAAHREANLGSRGASAG